MLWSGCTSPSFLVLLLFIPLLCVLLLSFLFSHCFCVCLSGHGVDLRTCNPSTRQAPAAHVTPSLPMWRSATAKFKPNYFPGVCLSLASFRAVPCLRFIISLWPLPVSPSGCQSAFRPTARLTLFALLSCWLSSPDLHFNILSINLHLNSHKPCA